MYGQYSRAVSNQERVMMARVRYVLEENVCKDTLTMSKFGSFEEQLYQIFNKTIHKYLHKYIPTIDRDDIRGPSVPIFVEYVVYKRRNVKSVHSSPRRLAGEKKISAIIIKQQFGFPMSTTKILSLIKFYRELLE